MVSLRRRRLLGLSLGHPGLPELETFSKDDKLVENPNQTVNPSSIQSMHLSLNTEVPLHLPEERPEVSNGADSSSSKEKSNHSFPGLPLLAGNQIKNRKQYRRKSCENEQTCMLRGVYPKNTKWQAAIKVDKKQIHLGTVDSKEEAAHLYDRAAFLRGREPNFELSEEEKQELGKYSWEEFLKMQRSVIANRKPKRRHSSGRQNKLVITLRS